MKKKLIALILALCAALSVAAFAACDDGNGEVGNGTDYKISLNSDTAVVFTATEDVLTLSVSTSLKDYLDALVTLEQITYESTGEGDSFYITSVNGNEQVYADTYMKYWSICTNLLEVDGVVYATTEYGTYDNNGSTLGYASYGAASLPCIEGYTYALVYTTYTY